jgi:hypothetical protein
MDPIFFQEVLNDVEQIARPRIAAWAEHPHEAFRRPFRPTTQLLEPYRRVDVIAKDGFPGIEISGEKAFNASPEKLGAVFPIRSEARPHRFLKFSRQRHFVAASHLGC